MSKTYEPAPEAINPELEAQLLAAGHSVGTEVLEAPNPDKVAEAFLEAVNSISQSTADSTYLLANIALNFAPQAERAKIQELVDAYRPVD